jgi:hypothetical protein
VNPEFLQFLCTAGEMLHVAEAFIDKNYHPTVICQGILIVLINGSFLKGYIIVDNA